jgi:ATP-dependent exoDNAse (exonuclease V) beta subunit
MVTDSSLDGEFVVVQGVADLAVILPREIWLIDFKTDAVELNELTGKAKFYTPQLKLYSRALSRIYGRAVSQAWLYFISVRKAVSIT